MNVYTYMQYINPAQTDKTSLAPHPTSLISIATTTTTVDETATTKNRLRMSAATCIAKLYGVTLKNLISPER